MLLLRWCVAPRCAGLGGGMPGRAPTTSPPPPGAGGAKVAGESALSGLCCSWGGSGLPSGSTTIAAVCHTPQATSSTCTGGEGSMPAAASAPAVKLTSWVNRTGAANRGISGSKAGQQMGNKHTSLAAAACTFSACAPGAPPAPAPVRAGCGCPGRRGPACRQSPRPR